jgi:hypothetical protein
MVVRGEQLQMTVDGQLERLQRVVAATDAVRARQPCPGRAKLGDGSIGTVVTHTVGNYSRIADFLAGGGSEDTAHTHHRHAHGHEGGFDPSEVAGRLEAIRSRFHTIGALDNEQLDSVPPAESFRFCDGQRTLEQVLTALLQHQGHQLDALETATQS